MPTKINFTHGREPAELKPVIAANKKGSLSKVVLGGDTLQCRIGQPLRKRTDRSRISAEYFVCEGVDLKDGKFQPQVDASGTLMDSNAMLFF